MIHLMEIDDSIPSFKNININGIAEQIEGILNENKMNIERWINDNNSNPNAKLLSKIEALNIPLAPLLDLLVHLRDVQSSYEIEHCLNRVSKKILEFNAYLMNNSKLYKIYQYLYQNIDIIQDKELKIILTKSLHNFKLSGFTLEQEKKVKLIQSTAHIQELGNLFERNISHSANALKISTHQYLTLLANTESREFRKEIYNAYFSIASPEDKNTQFDNTKIILEILSLRENIAKLLEYDNYAEYALYDRSFKSVRDIFNFLLALANAFSEYARIEINELIQFNKTKFRIDKLEPWDLEYISFKVLQEKYNFSQQELNLAVPEDKVLNTLFNLVKDLFDIQIEAVECNDCWSSEVKLYNIYNKTGDLQGRFYLDLYYRENKYPGAWCSEIRPRSFINEELKIPIACIVANFSLGFGKNALSHSDIIILFHEFGHCLQKLLTQINHPIIGGDNGIYLDATEIVSQFMENWAWQEDILSELYEDVVPSHLLKKTIQKMIFKKNFQIGLKMMQNIELALFDMIVHSKPVKKYNIGDKVNFLNILEEMKVYTNFIPFKYPGKSIYTFSHIFSRCFPAGYYSYLFSEMIAIEIFTHFNNSKNPIFMIGEHFKKTFLENGGLVNPIDLLFQFTGNAFSINKSIHNMLIYYGIRTGDIYEEII